MCISYDGYVNVSSYSIGQFLLWFKLMTPALVAFSIH